MTDTYINIRQVLDNLLTDPMMRDLSLERAVNYAVEFIRIVGMPALFEERLSDIEVHKHKGLLPCDLYEIIQVKSKCGPAYIYATSSFENVSGLTYKVQGRIIFTSLPDDILEIAYTAIKTDEDGFPLIPDNASFVRALELYIQKKWFTILFNSSKLPQAVLNNTQQEYSFAVAQAQSNLVKLSIDQFESIKNMWNTIIPRNNKHIQGFDTLNAPEVIRTH